MSTPSPQLSPRRRRTRARRLDAIVQAALDIVEDDSLDALTMSRLAEAVDLTPGALYRYFKSKDDLIAALQAHAVERIGRLFRERREAWRSALPEAPAIASLAEIVATGRFYLGLAESEPRAFRLIAATLGDLRPLVDDDAAGPVAEALGALLMEVSSLFVHAEQSGALSACDDPRTAGRRTILYWTSLHGIISIRKLDRLPAGAGWFSAEPLGDELTRTLLIGWGARPEHVTAASAWQPPSSPES